MKQMKQKKVLSPSNLPTRLPIATSVLAFLAMDYWSAPQWIWGAVGFFFVVIWVIAVIQLAHEKHIDLLGDED